MTNEEVHEYLASNPLVMGLLIIAFGIFLLLAAIFDWNIIFEDIERSNYSLTKLDGIINLFGRKAGRIFCGIISIIIIGSGIVWIWTNQNIT
ncbi:hypothetical protein JGH11_13985 [Dysgonomonas sp. Marseille-P4677]|uniref:Imm17 family immunity protein n=1 Tax=Dysgonomonas sp. Marseille-P4677 TaxID=2364790 RepID=UPI001912B058|nr:Imm17 family immunity protein [Dysgonomonas sp. Marseille-P4677]MBK5721984.1 hypothetical protein [Dysgonomonas sp. Marseille-P4677]